MKTENKTVVVENIEKKFDDFTAVNHISFAVNKGEIFGFLGPNGAGKSTTIKMLCGILRPTSGKGYVAGYDIVKEQYSIKQNIGYMSQKFSLYEDLTVEENIDFYSGIYSIPKEKKIKRKQWVIEMAGLEDLRLRKTKVLSGGWKQRLALGCAIIHEPSIVFLDEPTSGVDPISRKNFWKMIRAMANEGTTVFVTTHYMDEAENCDRLALIYRGSIIAMGTPRELKTDFMKDSVIEIVISNANEWIEKVKEISGVKEVSLFGKEIHAVVECLPQKAIKNLENMFSKNNYKSFNLEQIPPTLEDVFISLIENYDAKREV